MNRECMDDLLKRVDDFSGYVTELVGWIKEKGREFPHTEDLLGCTRGICDAVRDAGRSLSISKEGYAEAQGRMDEFCRLMGLLVKTGVLTEIQSKPLLSECMSIREEIAGLLK